MGPWLNCWEYRKCGREPGGAAVNTLGVCPAAIDAAANGVNHGVNGGRICWEITGTLCDGIIRGEFAQKQLNCHNCDFYRYVHQEEGPHLATLPGATD